MRIPSKSPVVVGVAGTSAALAAVRLAAREAVARSRPLKIVHAFTWPNDSSAGPDIDYDQARRSATKVVEEAITTAKRSTPGVRVTGHLVDGLPDRVLLQLSRTAEMIVLGGEELAGTARLPTGSVLVQTAARAWCPVVVARGSRPPAGPVLAAVDGSPWSLLGLRYAAETARRRSAPMLVVHVVAEAGGRAEAEGRRILAAVPELERSRSRLLVGPPAETLVRASGRARMIVLGARGTHGAGLLGSVAREVLHRGSCPTVIVHGPTVPTPRLAATRPAARISARPAK
jgi:nucleotide-binding universal stress UspA family protein